MNFVEDNKMGISDQWYLRIDDTFSTYEELT